MNVVKRIVLALAGMLAVLTVKAGADFYVDNLGYQFYTVEGNDVVVLSDGNRYSGKHLSVPATVVYNALEYHVKYIYALAFQGNTTIETVELADGVNLSTEAFKDMEALKSVKLPKSLTSIPKEAFRGCRSLERIVIPEGVTSIAMQAFRDCSSLKSVIIPQTLTRFYSYQAFAGCTSLEKITFPSIGAGGIYSDGDFSKYMSPPGSLSGTFDGCTNLKKVTFSSGDGSGTCPGFHSAFRECPSLQKLVLLYGTPNTYTSLPDDLYTSLTIVVPDTCVEVYRQTEWGGRVSNIISVTEYAREGISEEFANGQFFTLSPEDYTLTVTCESLVPGSGSYSSSGVYRDSGMTYAPWECYKSLIQHLVIEPAATGIGWGSFKGCDKLTSIDLPASITRIEETAFQNCKNLELLTIPAGVTTIGITSFLGCYGLKTIKVEEGNPSYDSRNNCNALIETGSGKLLIGCSNTAVPYGVKLIMPNAFFNTDIAKVDLPASVTTIAENAFRDCRKLTSVSIPQGVEEIRNKAFYGCHDLKRLEIPGSVKKIGDETFKECYSLSFMTMADGVDSIGDHAFDYCTSLVSAELPNTITSFGYGVFWGCSAMKSAVLPAHIAHLGSVFKDCTNLTSVTLPDDLETLSYLFEGCSSLASITLPAKVKELWGDNFNGCTNLSSITSLNPQPPACMGNIVGDYTIPLYVPKGSVLKYKAADGWRNFVIIREIAEGEESQDIWLTVNDGAKGSLRLKIDEERPYVTIQFVAEEGWHVYSVMLGEEDVTAELSADGTYTTPAINAETRLTVVYAEGETPDAIAGTRVNQPTVTVKADGISLNGLSAGDCLAVYTLEGHQMYNGEAKGSQVDIPLAAGKVYIVKLNDKALKVCL